MDAVIPTATRLLLPRQSSPSSSSSSTTCTKEDTTCQFLALIANPFSQVHHPTPFLPPNPTTNPRPSQLYTDAFYASLITSLGISALIALLFCFLRPYNNVVYAPRAKYADSKHAPPPVEKGLFGWIPPLLRTKEQDLVDKVGLDAAVFMRFIRMLRDMFLTLSVLGCGVLIPLYVVTANGSADGVFFFMRLTPLYMYGSQAFWAVVVLAYVFDIVICGFLWVNYRAVVRLRRAYFDSPDYQRSLHARTLLITDIPPELRSDEGIVQFTDSVKASDAVPRAAIARNTKDLPELVEEHEKAVRGLEKVLAKYLKDPNKLPPKRPTCKVSQNDKAYTKGQTVDAIEYLTSRIKELEVEIKEVRISVDKRNAMSYGFASYEAIPDAHDVAYLARKKGPKGTIIRLAPKPNDLVWKNLKMSKKERGWQNFIKISGSPFSPWLVKGSKAGGNVWNQFENSHPFQLVVSALCQVSPYWISWVLQRNLGAALDLSQLISLLWSWVQKRFFAPTPRELIELTAPQPFDYAGYYNYFLFYATVAMCFATLQPLVLPVTAFYFALDSFLKKYLLLYIFITKYESGGMFWRSLANRLLAAALLGNIVVALLVTAQGNLAGANWGMLAALAPLPFLLLAFKIYCMRAFDDAIHYYHLQGSAAHEAVVGVEGKTRSKGERSVGVRFGHPVLYKPLMTPMVAAKSQHLLKTIYSGRTSLEENNANAAAGYSDIYMDAMDQSQAGKASGGGGHAPFEIVGEHQLDFAHWKHSPQFRDEHGGNGEVFGRAQDSLRPGTAGAGSMMTRTFTGETDGSRSRSESRGGLGGRGRRSESRDSEATRVGAGETEYPRGYHMTPSALREGSPEENWGLPGGRGRLPLADTGMHDDGEEEGREGLVASAARMGKSPPFQR
ncbi:hypothetical protein LTR91_017016 [Friedmanniomyces endolithicus]|uniref:CSC1/OSCA1-like 7TM region domain-containing protein n=1 Tax=Friedmanniomyces endolithicus TaxID=329885 RepID=A0AAN6K6U3_9PEZI|nr:hypothetical protein LTR57_024298 [Friedmanniomyces endolithicus]KAK0967710.1 hypothetical protein LTR91_017016 [Friedmanniomyces endolithicus]KAK0986415.1 hypothetical protein LTS01_009940 [Friedmanniomyces endolithicus]